MVSSENLGNENWQQFARKAIEGQFPNLTPSNYLITSPDTIDYNCVAWAAEDSTAWWWPDAQNIYYWPDSVPREVTLEAFIQAYQLLGYKVCETATLELGLQKIAIYSNQNDRPVHVARQLPSGRWTSKLGSYEDIEHETLTDLSGEHPAYGKVLCFMVRTTIAKPIQT